jgi:hypothetical protein
MANGQCYMNSLFNREHALARLDLHMVHGSLGLGRGSSRFFEFGGAHWLSIDDFMSSSNSFPDYASRMFLDAHVWLEDRDGRIYDYVTDAMRGVCATRGLRPIDPSLTVIEGRTTASLRQQGMWHVAAPLAVQRQLAQQWKSWDDTYVLYMKHFYQRVYDVNVNLSP